MRVVCTVFGLICLMVLCCRAELVNATAGEVKIVAAGENAVVGNVTKPIQKPTPQAEKINNVTNLPVLNKTQDKIPTPKQLDPPKPPTRPPPPPPIKSPTPKETPIYCLRKQDPRTRKFPKQPNPKSRQRLVTTNYGFDMYVDAKDSMVSNTIAFSGTWEPNYINLIGHIVRPGDRVLNLGSQSGLEAIIMGKIVGPQGRLFIFEPYSFSHSLVTKNIQLNSLSNITTIYKNGASDTKSSATIQIAYSNTGGSEILPTSQIKPKINNRPPGYNEQEQVQLDRVDSLLPEDAVLDFALVDVEKMEVKALRGMKGVVERSPGLVIMTEWQYGRNPRKNKEEAMELLNYMVERGYKIYSYTGGNPYNCRMGKFHQFPKLEDLLRIDFMDIFFIPTDHWLLKK